MERFGPTRHRVLVEQSALPMQADGQEIEERALAGTASTDETSERGMKFELMVASEAKRSPLPS